MPAPRRRKSAPAFVDPIAHLSPTQRRKLPVNIVGSLRCMVPAPTPTAQEKPPKPLKKNNPKLVAAARELRDRWLDAVNTDPCALLAAGKYDIARALPEAQTVSTNVIQVKALPQAA